MLLSGILTNNACFIETLAYESAAGQDGYGAEGE